MPSRYSQRTKTGSNVLDFDAFYKESLGIWEAYPAKRLGAQVGAWRKTFGEDAVRVRPLESARLSGGMLLTDFAEAVRMPAALRHLLPANRKNASPGWQLIELMRASHIDRGGARARASSEGLADPEAMRLGSLIWRAGRRAADAIGLAQDPGVYLTAVQADCLSELYAHEARRIGVAVQRSATGGTRSFLPSAELIPVATRRAFAEALEAALASDDQFRQLQL